MASGLEALGANAEAVSKGLLRLGVIVCVMSACVNYSRRFYDEALKDPSTASPLVFPETVFNAPASHIAAFLGSRAINYTLVGDPGTFLVGVATAADWLLNDRVDGCLVVGSEEADWLTAEAYALFQPAIVMGEGSGALFLQRKPVGESSVELSAITSPQQFTRTRSRARAAKEMKDELAHACLNGKGAKTDAVLLCDSQHAIATEDAAEKAAWNGWAGPQCSVKAILGEGLMAAAAWQCVAAVDALKNNQAEMALVSVVGANQQAIGAAFKGSAPGQGT
jgi:3-oxoacyl-(acyl-carrier-protein) synthase